LILFSYSRQGADNQEIVFSAEFVPLPKIIAPPPPDSSKKQIVSPSIESPKEPNPALKVFESEQDSFSLKQQIRRGEDGFSAASNIDGASSPKPQPARISKEPAEKAKQQSRQVAKEQMPQTSSKPLSKTLNLKLDESALAEIAIEQKQRDNSESSNYKLQQAIQSAQTSDQKSSVNVSRLGSRDYLPDIPDGDVTLLNAKANKYAVFVRRVASQVFANLRGAGWRTLQAADIRSISKDGIFEAILSPKGELISVSLTSSSNSPRFDAILNQAIKRGAKDPNPPQGAEAEDGNIHFIFQARSWVQIQANARTGAPVERRWLVLGTGLE
jgi:hypothetical protein